MLKIILFIVLAYFLYKLVFHFIIPVYMTTKQMKKGFREMQEKMNQQFQQQDQEFQKTSSQQPPKKQEPGEYIEFEDVK